MNHTHKRQNSTGNFSAGLNVDQNNPLETSFYSLDYFMNVSKLMEDEIMVPTKLKDKTFEKKRNYSVSIMEQLENGNDHDNGRPPAAPKSERKLSNGNGDEEKQNDSSANEETEEEDEADALDQYRFIRLIRNQLLQAKPFNNNVEEYNANVFKNKQFKKTYDSMNYHYRQLMTILDNLSTDARSITEIYRENV